MWSCFCAGGGLYDDGHGCHGVEGLCKISIFCYIVQRFGGWIESEGIARYSTEQARKKIIAPLKSTPFSSHQLVRLPKLCVERNSSDGWAAGSSAASFLKFQNIWDSETLLPELLGKGEWSGTSVSEYRSDGRNRFSIPNSAGTMRT